MRPSLLLVPALVLSFPVWAVEPQVTAVLLTQAGVATVEQEAKVKGEDTLDLTVPFSQVDDVLKSLIVLDTAGAVQRVTLAGSSDDSALADLPVPPEALTSLPALLHALIGQSIEIDNTLRSQKGRLMAVIEREEPQGKDRADPARRLVLSLLTDAGLTEAILEPGATVRLADKALQARLDRALTRLAEGRDRSARTLSVAVSGQGERVVKLAYVVAAPVWKATYRLDLAPDGKTARLQGWAVLENRTGKDWKNIRLTLSSGQPVTFRQPLYASTWVDRPEVPLNVAKVKPLEADKGAVEMRMAAAAAAPVAMAKPSSAPALDLRTSAPVSTAAASENLTQIDLTLPHPVSVAAGQSLSVPIIDQNVSAQQVLVWDTSQLQNALQAAVDVTNGGATSLPPGVVALYDGPRGFVGDGRLDLFPKGESRFIAYARDGRAKLTRKEESSSRLQTLTVARGVIKRTDAVTYKTNYRVVLPAGDTRPILIDQPRPLPPAVLTAPTQGVKETPRGYRFTLAGGEDRSLDVVIDRTNSTEIDLLRPGLNWTILAASATEYPPAVQTALKQAHAINSRLDTAQKEASSRREARSATEAEQKRLRDSLPAVPSNSDLARRYLKDLTALEDKLADQQKGIEAMQAAATAAKKELDDFLSTLTLP